MPALAPRAPSSVFLRHSIFLFHWRAEAGNPQPQGACSDDFIFQALLSHQNDRREDFLSGQGNQQIDAAEAGKDGRQESHRGIFICLTMAVLASGWWRHGNRQPAASGVDQR